MGGVFESDGRRMPVLARLGARRSRGEAIHKLGMGARRVVVCDRCRPWESEVPRSGPTDLLSRSRGSSTPPPPPGSACARHAPRLGRGCVHGRHDGPSDSRIIGGRPRSQRSDVRIRMCVRTSLVGGAAQRCQKREAVPPHIGSHRRLLHCAHPLL